MAHRLLKFIISLLLLFYVGCRNNSVSSEKNGTIAPRMMFKTTSSMSSFEPPISVRKKAAMMFFDVNTSDGDHIHKEIDFHAGYVKFDNLSEGNARIDIKILDVMHIPLMEGGADIHINSDETIQSPQIEMFPIIPMTIEQPEFIQICDFKMRLIVKNVGILNVFNVTVKDNTNSVIGSFDITTDLAQRDISGNYFVVDSSVSYPAVSSPISVIVTGNYYEDGSNYTVPQSYELNPYWNLGTPCNTLNPPVPIINNIRQLCKEQVELIWGPNDNTVEGYKLILEAKEPLSFPVVWNIVDEREISLWTDYVWDGNNFKYTMNFPYSTLSAYRFSIMSIVGGVTSAPSNYVEFVTIQAPDICP
jgi:hypothetical protein